MPISFYDVKTGTTVFGGKTIISREFFNPDTKDYVLIEAHETETKDDFRAAFWVPDGNDGDHQQPDAQRTMV